MDLPSSTEGAITAFVTLVGAVVATVIRITKEVRKRDDARMASVPPTQTADELREHIATLSRRLDTHERDVRLLRAMQREQDLAERVSELEKELREAREDRDQAQRAYADARVEMQRLRRELERLRARRG